MPIAAVPSYLGKDFAQASPGMRFGMYLTLWGVNRRTKDLLWTTHDVRYEKRGPNRQEREIPDENKVPALADAKQLNKNDKRIMEELAARQKHSFGASMPKASLRIDAIAIGPFTTGLGNEHPLENGFAFLNPYGLPYLPGSGVKGVVRQAARELASGQWGETLGWSDEKRYRLQIGEETVLLSMMDVLLGRESGEGDTKHVRGVLSFWDVIPLVEGDSLLVEIMTPHQRHYYEWKKDRDGNETPHDSGQPNPITFLTVPPGSKFTFHVTCDLPRLKVIVPDLAKGEQWRELLSPVFEHAFTWLGFGAKTSVGYGAFQRDMEAEEETQKQVEELQTRNAEKDGAQRLAAMPEEARELLALENLLQKEKAAGRADIQGPLSGGFQTLRKKADSWDQQYRAKLADLGKQIYDFVGWGKKRKEREEQISQLRQPGS